jgi:GNAT superfamily N-acetyltransferase
MRLKEIARTPPLLLAQKLLRQVPRRPIDVGRLCFLQLEGLPQVPSSTRVRHIEVRFATMNDLDALCGLQDKRGEFEQRLRNGDKCIVASIRGRVVGYEWICDSGVHREAEWDYPITIPGGYVYAYDAFIDPAYRNTGVWLRFKQYLAGWMAAQGKQGVLTFVDYGNWPSLRTHLRFGFQPTGSVLALRIAGLTLFRKMRAVGAAAWSLLAGVAMYPHVHVHHAARVAHMAIALSRR